MIELKGNELEGQYAAPDHPITCANPAPWKITEMRIEVINSYTDPGIKLWIRGEGSMWFRADQCMIGDENELKEILEMQAIEKQCHNFTYGD